MTHQQYATSDDFAAVWAAHPLATHPFTAREHDIAWCYWELGRLSMSNAMIAAAAGPSPDDIAAHNSRVTAWREATARHGRAWADLVLGGGDAA